MVGHSGLLKALLQIETWKKQNFYDDGDGIADEALPGDTLDAEEESAEVGNVVDTTLEERGEAIRLLEHYNPDADLLSKMHLPQTMSFVLEDIATGATNVPLVRRQGHEGAADSVARAHEECHWLKHNWVGWFECSQKGRKNQGTFQDHMVLLTRIALSAPRENRRH